jgi:peptide/nickel transport system permease protein
MHRYVYGRLGQALLVLWAAFTVSFVLLQVLPGDAVLIKFQDPDMGLSPAQIADMCTLPVIFCAAIWVIPSRRAFR